MPNHIRNRVEIIGTDDQIEEVFNFLKSSTDEEQLIDFNNITPMPKWVYGSSPDVTGISHKDYEKYGRENTCLDWRSENWGTKWNAYDSYRSGNTLHFDTANGSPAQLINKVAWLFPEVTIKHFFYDSMNFQTQFYYTFKDTEIEQEVKEYEFNEETDKWEDITGGEE